MTNTCPPTDTSATTCTQMMAEALTAYNAVRRGMMSGKVAVEVQFGEERVKYQATSETSKFLLEEITRLHRSCPCTASAAILGLGGASAGPIGVSFGSGC